MATYRIIFWISFFILRYSLVECNKRTLIYTNATYTHCESVNFSATVNNGAITLYLTTFKDLEHFVIDLDVFVKTDGSATFTQMSKTTMDACRLLSNAGSNIFISRILEPVLLSKQNKIFRKCPVKKVTFNVKITKIFTPEIIKKI